jgi:hypothetical protein
MIEAWDTGAYRDVREIWERAEILGGENKFKGELIRGLHALTGHLEYDIGQIRSAVSALSALSGLEENTSRFTPKPECFIAPTAATIRDSRTMQSNASNHSLLREINQ